jgi:hypothetical protein
MDLSTIKKRLDNPAGSNGIRTTVEFQRDIMLMFQNALMYNKPDHEVYKDALIMQKDILDSIEDFIESENNRDMNSPIPPTTFPPIGTIIGKIPSTPVASSVCDAAATPSSIPKQKRERRSIAIGSSVSFSK